MFFELSHRTARQLLTVVNYASHQILLVWWAVFQWNVACCLLRSLRFAVRCDRFGLKSDCDWIIQRNDITSSLLCGGPACLKASAFDRSSLIPWWLRSCPENWILSLMKMLFSGFRIKPRLWSFFIMLFKILMYSFFDFVAITTTLCITWASGFICFSCIPWNENASKALMTL